MEDERKAVACAKHGARIKKIKGKKSRFSGKKVLFWNGKKTGENELKRR